MSNHRTELHKEIIEALVQSKAIDFEAVGAVFAKFGARAALTGDGFGFIIHRPVIIGCIPPFSVDPSGVLDRQFAAGATKER